MIQFNKIFRGTGCDKRFGIDSISTMIELYGSLTHPPPRLLGKSTCDNQPHIKSKSGCTNDLLGVSQSNSQRTDSKNSVEFIMIPTRFLGVSFCLKEVS